MAKKHISKATRFEVFKRDKFTCQYCGESAPDVILHVDHIDPKSKGGSNNITNLITACASCNLGKSDKKLSDESAVKKSKAQLDALQERRNQIEMMAEWQRQLAKANDDMVNAVCQIWESYTNGVTINEQGRITIRKIIRRFGFLPAMEAAQISAERYLAFNGDGRVSMPSAKESFDKIGGICYNRRKQDGMGQD